MKWLIKHQVHLWKLILGTQNWYWSQFLHSNIWAAKIWGLLKSNLQLIQSVWFFSCDLALLNWLNFLSQNWHLYGFSPEWIILCRFKCAGTLNVLLQILQIFGLFSSLTFLSSLSSSNSWFSLVLPKTRKKWIFNKLLSKKAQSNQVGTIHLLRN